MARCPINAATLDQLSATEVGLALRNVSRDGAVSDGVTNDNAAILAAIAAGHTRLFLPANTLWIPTSNLIPGNVEYWGGDWLTTVVKAANPNSEWLSIGPHASLHSIAFWDRVGFDGGGGAMSGSGGTTNGPRPVRHIENTSNDYYITTHYYGTGTVLNGGMTGLDQNPLLVQGEGIGDAIHVSAQGDSVGIRIYVNNPNEPTGTCIGLMTQCFGTSSGIHMRSEAGSALPAGTGMLHSVPTVDATSVAIVPTVPTTTDFIVTTSVKTAGQMINLFHNTSAFAGNGLSMNFAAGSGSFSGFFIRLLKNSVDMFSVDSNGRATVGSLAVGTPLLLSGTNTPEGAVTAPVGSLFLRTDGGASTTLYVKQSGAGNTGWAAK